MHLPIALSNMGQLVPHAITFHEMSQNTDFIELDRQFLPLDSDRDTEESVSRSYLGSTWLSPSAVGWPDLLSKKRIIILGEAGSGKTWEIRHQFEANRNAGRVAFHFELEQLISRKPEQLLSKSDRKAFQRWLNGSEPCVIFLDSVDEAKLRRQVDFHRALQSLQQSLDFTAIRRATLVITSRISEWQPSTDLDVLKRLFCTIPRRQRATATSSVTEEADESIGVSVYQIAPLDRERVSTLASGLGLTDSTSFIDAIDQRYAWEFARRPLDVFDLLEFWRANGRIGTLTEVLEHDVTNKLRETSQRIRDDCLSPERSRQGAEFLAAGTILCKSPNFKVPDDSFIASGSLDAVDCLPEDWTSAEVSALLSRALFDGASYGHVRFHHRRVAEYLAAQWIARLMSQGCTTGVLKDLLTTESDGAIALRPSLVPVTVWLAAGADNWNEEVRSWILKSSPEVHLEFGDPESLALSYRLELLRSWIESQSGRDSVWVDSSPETLSRLADTDLGNDISDFLKDCTNSIDVRSELVLLVRFGRIENCLPSLIDILSDSTESDRLKAYAMAAIRDMGTAESRQHAWRCIESYPTLSERLCSVACEALYPQVLSAEQLIQLLEKTKPIDDEFHNLLWTLQRHVADYVPSCEAAVLLTQLNQLVRKRPHVRVSGEETHISAHFRWILRLLPTVVLLLLKNESLDERERHAAGDALDLLSEGRRFNNVDSEAKGDLNSASHAHPGVRREFFWRVARRLMQAERGRHPHALLWFDFGEVLAPSNADIAWLIEDVATRPDQLEREAALKAVLQLMPSRDRRSRRRLKLAASDHASLRDILRADGSARRWAWYYRLKQSFSDHTLKFRFQRWRHKLGEYWQFVRDQWYLHRHLRSLSKGELTYALGRLCREAEHTGHKWAPTNWDKVTKRRGRYIAQSARMGCKVAWREFQPELPHEKDEPNKIDNRVVVGLAGLEACFQDDNSFSQSLSAHDARNAVRYAINEMNGYPEWLGSVVKHHEADVAHVLNKCVLGEWNYPAEREHVHDAISRLSWEGGRLARLVRQKVITCMLNGDPSNRKVFEDSLNLLLKTIEPSEIELGDIALARCSELDIDSDAFSIWAAVAIQLQAQAALELLERRLEGSVIADQVWLELCEYLGGDMRPRLHTIPTPDYYRVAALTRLITNLFQHVRPDNDIKRGQGPYTPTSRDEAQRFRDGLITRLAESESGDATEKLRELLNNDALSSYHDWIRHLIAKRMRERADSTPWREVEVSQFAVHMGRSARLKEPQMRILFLTANPLTDDPDDWLDLENECRSIKEELRKAKFRNQISLSTQPAARPDDLINCVREEKPNIVHFSGHGADAGIYIRDEYGDELQIDGDTLSQFLSNREVDLVVLNACSSKDVAAAIMGAVKAVVGTTDELGDEDARRFTMAFYRSLGEGLTVGEAFRDGRDAVNLHGGDDVFHSEGDLDIVFVSDA